jgi:death-on-curing protein
VTEPEWLLPEFVVALHERLLADFGGPAGVRDESLLESALNRPQHLFSYGTPSLAELAAAYAFGIVRNHPLVDGNKRTGFAAAAVFLEINKQRLTALESEAVVNTLALAAGEISEEAFAGWLERNSRAASDR